jgi:hypothetical protein
MKRKKNFHHSFEILLFFFCFISNETKETNKERKTNFLAVVVVRF